MRHLAQCILCGSHDATVVYPSTLGAGEGYTRDLDPYGGHYRINRCAGCGLIFSSPTFEDAEVAALYESGRETNVAAGEERNVRRTMALYYRTFRAELPGRDRFLDVGCDVGYMLETARSDGFRELYGLEPVPAARRVAARIPGATVSGDFYEDAAFPADGFDAITFIHVLDHLIDPAPVIAKAFGELKPGGIAFAVVHNVESLLARVTGERFPPFNFYHHFFFSARTLAELFRRAGFEVLRVVPTRNAYSLSHFVRSLPALPSAAKDALARALDAVGLGRLSLCLPVGNIGIVARKPAA